MSLIPFPAYAPDIADYQGNSSLTISGVVPRGDGYGPVPSPLVYTVALAGICRGAFVAWKNDGTVVIIAATATRIYRLDNTTLLWVEISNGPGPFNISNATWASTAGGRATFITTAPHGFVAGTTTVTITGVNPSGYNGQYATLAGTTGSTIIVALPPSTPGTYVSGGAVRGSNPYTALAATDQWQFAQFGNDVIAVQANTTPQYYDLLGSLRFADLVAHPGSLGTAPNARYVSIVGRFVVLSGLPSNPYAVQWSGLNAPATWNGTNSSDTQVLPDGGIVRGVAGGESGLILQDSAIRKMTYTQETTLVFQIERISHDKGLYAPYSLTQAGETVFFVSPQGLHRFAPGELPVEIGKAKFNRTLMNDLDRSQLQMVIGASDPRQTRMLLTYNSISNTATTNFDKILCYDYLLDRATIIPLAGEYLFTMAQPGSTLESLDTPFPGGTSVQGIDTPGMPSLDTFGNALTPELAVFDTSHRLCFFRGGPLEATLDTAEQGTDGQRLRIRGFRPITDATTVFGSLVSRETVQRTGMPTPESAINALGICPQHKSTRYARGRIRIPADTPWTYAVGVEPDFTLEGLK